MIYSVLHSDPPIANGFRSGFGSEHRSVFLHKRFPYLLRFFERPGRNPLPLLVVGNEPERFHSYFRFDPFAFESFASDESKIGQFAQCGCRRMVVVGNYVSSDFDLPDKVRVPEFGIRKEDQIWRFLARKCRRLANDVDRSRRRDRVRREIPVETDDPRLREGCR